MNPMKEEKRMKARVRRDAGCAKVFAGRLGTIINCEEREDGYYYTLRFKRKPTVVLPEWKIEIL